MFTVFSVKRSMRDNNETRARDLFEISNVMKCVQVTANLALDSLRKFKFNLMIFSDYFDYFEIIIKCRNVIDGSNNLFLAELIHH